MANVDLGEGGVPRGSTVGQVDAPVLVSVLVRVRRVSGCALVHWRETPLLG